MASDDSTLPPSERPANPWPGLLLWPSLVGLAWLLFELTAQPGLSVPLLCAKFGWDDYLTARWLKRSDPDRRRGRMCYWFYVSSSLWRMAVAATIIMFALSALMGILENRRRNQPGPAVVRPPTAKMVAALLVSFVGFGASGIATYVAVGRAFRCRHKVWVDSRIHQARRENAWPPPYWSLNKASRLLTTALMPLIPIIFLAAMLAAIPFWQLQLNVFLIFFLVMTLVVLAATLTLLLRDYLAERVVARTPYECWGDTLLDHYQ